MIHSRVGFRYYLTSGVRRTFLRSSTLFLMVSVFSVGLPAGSSYADDAHIVDVHVKKRYAKVLVSANLEHVFTKDVREALMSGMPVTFTYSINLRRDRSVIWDKREADIKVHKVVKYDSLTKEFNGIEVISETPPDPENFEKELEAIKLKNRETLFSEDKEPFIEINKRHLVLNDMNALEGWMSVLKDVPVGDTRGFQKNKTYYAQVKAEMKSPSLSVPFNYILFFLSSLEFQTEWEDSTAFVVEKPGLPLERMFGKNGR